MQLHKRDPKCGPKSSSKQSIVAAATAILDNYGIADLTMRRLARDLGITPGALYWHFTNKQQLLGAVADQLLGPACAGPQTTGWRQRVETQCIRLRDALLSHTDGAELVSASLAAGQSHAAAAILSRLADAATDAGLGPDHAEVAARTVIYYVLGFTADEQSRLQWDAAGASVGGPAAKPDRDFRFGLQLLTDGLAAHAAAPAVS